MYKRNKHFNLLPSIGQLSILMSIASLLLSILLEQNNNHFNSNFFVQATKSVSRKDINRKSLVFDVKTPKVFYCQQEKQSDYDKIIVKARPLENLCEYDGFPKPKNKPSDCFNDIDETEFACDEKKRFLIRLESPPTDFDIQQQQSTMEDKIKFKSIKKF